MLNFVTNCNVFTNNSQILRLDATIQNRLHVLIYWCQSIRCPCYMGHSKTCNPKQVNFSISILSVYKRDARCVIESIHAAEKKFEERWFGLLLIAKYFLYLQESRPSIFCLRARKRNEIRIDSFHRCCELNDLYVRTMVSVN